MALAAIALAIPLARHATAALEPTPAVSNEPAPALLAISALLVALVGGTFSNRLKTWKPEPTGAVAETEVLLVRLTRGDLSELIDAFPRISRNVITVLTRYMRNRLQRDDGK